jgi:2-amino-4-hydroxy-6-hydroxymethyldihydropteridine diphosphokinase
MARVYLGLGSNIDAEANLALGVRELRSHYGELDLSPVYRSAAVGFDGADFLNMVVGLDTDDAPCDIQAQIELIHDLAGRERGDDPFSSRPLDIDLLLYDDLVSSEGKLRLPRRDVLEYSFVLRPLAELDPNLVHPETGRSVAEHWREFDAASHPLEPVNVIM